jgi:long-chain acyl-CoA synthetase
LVLGNGKNIAPLPIENRIRESRFISEVVVLGDGLDHCIALLLPNKEAVRDELGLSEGVAMADNDDVRKLFKKELDKVNKQIAHFEMVKKFAIIDDVFTIENGFLTPKMSIKRKVVKEKYADVIASLG